MLSIVAIDHLFYRFAQEATYEANIIPEDIHFIYSLNINHTGKTFQASDILSDKIEACFFCMLQFLTSTSFILPA